MDDPPRAFFRARNPIAMLVNGLALGTRRIWTTIHEPPTRRFGRPSPILSLTRPRPVPHAESLPYLKTSKRTMKLSNIFPSVSAMLALGVAFTAPHPAVAAADAAHAHANSIGAAVRDALLQRSHGRYLQDLSACASETAALDTCASGAMTYDEQTACATCMNTAFQNALPAVSSSNADCSAFNTYVCAPVQSCQCLSPCVDEYNPLAECIFTATAADYGLSLVCDVNCGSSTTGGGSDGAADNGSSGGEGTGSSSPGSSANKADAVTLSSAVGAVFLALAAYV